MLKPLCLANVSISAIGKMSLLGCETKKRWFINPYIFLSFFLILSQLCSYIPVLRPSLRPWASSPLLLRDRCLVSLSFPSILPHMLQRCDSNRKQTRKTSYLSCSLGGFELLWRRFIFLVNSRTSDSFDVPGSVQSALRTEGKGKPSGSLVSYGRRCRSLDCWFGDAARLLGWSLICYIIKDCLTYLVLMWAVVSYIPLSF